LVAIGKPLVSQARLSQSSRVHPGLVGGMQHAAVLFVGGCWCFHDIDVVKNVLS
jgi:hypothetical protein